MRTFVIWQPGHAGMYGPTVRSGKSPLEVAKAFSLDKHHEGTWTLCVVSFDGLQIWHVEVTMNIHAEHTVPAAVTAKKVDIPTPPTQEENEDA